MNRRHLLRAGLAAGLAAVVTGCDTSPPVGSPATTAAGSSPPPTPNPRPPAMTSPAVPALTATLRRFLQPTRENPDHPTYAGAVALVLVGGTVSTRVVVGDALRYRAGPVELPPAQRVAMRADSIFDLASVTKVYTAILTLQQVDRGRVDLAAPVSRYLSGFIGAGKSGVTVAQLLAHTSGLPVGASVSGRPDEAARRAAVLATPLVPGAVPGRVFRYSSVGFMVLGQLVEQVTGERLDAALHTGITGPLGLRETGFRPLDWVSRADLASRMVATDARSSRGLLRGIVHDDVANTMGGVAGHAGIFSTAAEVAVIAEVLRTGGAYGGTRILSAAIVDRMRTNLNRGLPAIDPDRPHRSSEHGLGVELNQPWFMGRLADPTAFGHTGFTGTSLLAAPSRQLSLVVLTNRAHPNWSWADPDPVRAAAADDCAQAVPAGMR